MRIRVFKVRYFDRWMRKTLLTDEALCTAVAEMAAGLVDADLGGGVLKKRIPLPGKGKSGGFRTLLATNRGDRWFFLFGFEKSERSTISAKEETALKSYATELLSLTAPQLDDLTTRKKRVEICHEQQEGQAGTCEPPPGLDS